MSKLVILDMDAWVIVVSNSASPVSICRFYVFMAVQFKATLPICTRIHVNFKSK